MERAWRMRWVVVAIAASAVFVGGPLAGDIAYALTKSEQTSQWAYIASVTAHFAAVVAIVGAPVARFFFTAQR